ncbi:MAG: hypothetical protein Q8O99_08245 [bacterium]|nr:hypothetical protein [bacterium]
MPLLCNLIMKLTFSSKDSIYKIFKIIKKIPHGKTVDIFLDDHPLLSQPWRIDALVQQLQESSLQVTITTGNKQIAQQLKTHCITVICTTGNAREKRLYYLIPSNLFSSSTRLPSRDYFKSKLSLVTELLVLGVIIYIFR